jgi:hypothetical protein
VRITPPALALAVLMCITACATKGHLPTDSDRGISFGVGVKADATTAARQAREQLVKNARSQASKTAVESALTPEALPGALYIGNVGSYYEVLERARGAFFQKIYLPNARTWLPTDQAPTMTEAEFVVDFGGYTSLTTWSIPGLATRRREVLVRAADAAIIRFPGRFSTRYFGTTGDLVVAETNADGMIFVERILCKDDDSYSQCATAYARGIYDKNTGDEIGSDFTPKPGGMRIDTKTLRNIPTSK